VLSFKFLEPVSEMESRDFLRNIIRAAGTTWLERVLINFNIPKRSIIVNSFRKSASYRPSKGSWTLMLDRSEENQKESVIKLLDERPLIFWIDIFLKTYKVYDLIPLVNKKDFVIYVTKEDI
jgi:hypothetical protein